jgi:NIMA (never in mitosis gene a)-related kinase
MDALFNSFRIRPSENFKDRYAVGDFIESGGYSEIRVVIDKTSGVRYAGKFINARSYISNDAMKEMLDNEIYILKNYHHPNIINLVEYFSDDGVIILIMELADKCLIDVGRISMKEAVRITIDLCRAVDYLHSNGILHLDIKPDNIFLMKDGTVKLGDFGSAVFIDNCNNKHIVSTIDYTSPFMLKGDKCLKANDVWAIIVTLYTITTLRHPFGGNTEKDTMQNILSRKFKPHPSLNYIFETTFKSSVDDMPTTRDIINLLND